MNNEIIIALITTFFGGIGLETIKIVASSVEKREAEKRLDRENLTKQMLSLEEKIESLQASIDSWREKYFLIKEEVSMARTYISVLADILDTKNPSPSEKDLIDSIRKKVLRLD